MLWLVRRITYFGVSSLEVTGNFAKFLNAKMETQTGYKVLSKANRYLVS